MPILPILYLRWTEKWHESHPWGTCFISLLFLVVVPTCFGFVTGLARQHRFWLRVFDRLGLQAFNGIPSAWEAYFSEARRSWVIVTLKTGQRVYGFYGEGSFVATDPKNRDIYISQTVVAMDGRFQLVENAGGVYIPASEVLTIEFIREK